MSKTSYNKRKILNDPVYGFIAIPNELVFDIIEHKYFQRLRRIKQLGLTHLVYPGALHTRFQHAIGAMNLMTQAIEVLRSKGNIITELEADAVIYAILLHDIGHGPFSHALESTLVKDLGHETLSALFMYHLNLEFDGRLGLAIDIFNNRYHKKFLHQLVSSQLDVDRLDYLKRDSFFSGVSEGVINSDRLIAMLDVKDDELVVEAKGIYSLEKFIVARRLMYWQVYLHKTVIAAEYMLVKVLERAKKLAEDGVSLFATPSLNLFLKNNFSKQHFKDDKQLLDQFSELDDFDIFTAMKVWQTHSDPVLSFLSDCIVNRKLFKIEIRKEPFSSDYIELIKSKTQKELNISEDETNYVVLYDRIENNAYNPQCDRIGILNKDGTVVNVVDSSDQINVSVLTRMESKYFICYPKRVNIS
ncbi:MAG: HD domain-containing protein [Bacteroidales bacterium]|nr:HD domain-containing protein [Bacteroidales bacterium]